MTTAKTLTISASKGRCRSTSFTVGGSHTNKEQQPVTCLWPGTDERVRVKRDSRGEITALDTEGEPFVLQHVKDAAALKRLFTEQGVNWDGTGVFCAYKGVEEGDQTAAGPEHRILLDEQMLSGNYPESMPEDTRKAIGKIIGKYSKTPGLNRNDFRRARAKLIHETWLNGNRTLDEQTVHGTLRRFCPALTLLELSDSHMRLMQTIWDEYTGAMPVTEENRTSRVLGGEHPVAHTFKEFLIKPMVSAKSVGEEHGGRVSFVEFMRIGLSWEEEARETGKTARSSYNITRSFRQPDGSIRPAVPENGQKTGLLRDDIQRLWSEHQIGLIGLAPPKQTKDGLWCHKCQGTCGCEKGRRALEELSRNLKTQNLMSEHRWGADSRIKVTRRIQKEAGAMEQEVAAKLEQILGTDAWQKLEQTAGHGLAKDTSILLAQLEAGADDLDETFVTNVLMKEASGATERAQTLHAKWGRRIQELEELGTTSPKTAVFLGRDGIYGFWAFQELETLGLIDTDKIQAVYVSASRVANSQSLKKLRALSKDETGEDIVYVDTGFRGTIPTRIVEEVFGDPGRNRHQETGQQVEHRVSWGSQPTGLKSSMRLMSAVKRANSFIESIGQSDVNMVEHDAKGNYSSRAVVVGKDGGTPTAAMEQFVARRLKTAIEQQTRQEAEHLKKLSPEQQAETYYTEDCVRLLHGEGLSFEELVDYGRKGLTYKEIWALKHPGEQAPVLAIPRSLSV